MLDWQIELGEGSGDPALHYEIHVTFLERQADRLRVQEPEAVGVEGSGDLRREKSRHIVATSKP